MGFSLDHPKRKASQILDVRVSRIGASEAALHKLLPRY
jgi:hypothetical protein